MPGTLRRPRPREGRLKGRLEIIMALDPRIHLEPGQVVGCGEISERMWPRSVLKQLSDLEKTLGEKENRMPRQLIGVYAGWRGLSIKSDYFPLPLGKETTFWSRKNAAQRVGGYGALTELIMDLEEVQRNSNH